MFSIFFSGLFHSQKNFHIVKKIISKNFKAKKEFINLMD